MGMLMYKGALRAHRKSQHDIILSRKAYQNNKQKKGRESKQERSRPLERALKPSPYFFVHLVLQRQCASLHKGEGEHQGAGSVLTFLRTLFLYLFVDSLSLRAGLVPRQAMPGV